MTTLLVILLKGEKNAGASSIAQRFTKDKFEDCGRIPLFSARKTKIGDYKVCIRLCEEDYSKSSRIDAFKKPSGILDGLIFIYDITDYTSWENVQHKIDNLSWYDTFSHLIIVGNKCDLNEQRVVSVDEVREYAQTKGLMNFEMSAKTSENVEEAIIYLAHALMLARVTKKLGERKKCDPVDQK